MTIWSRWKTSPELRTKVRRWLLVAMLVDVLVLFAMTSGSDWFYDPRRRNPPGRVIVYSTSWCPACERLRRCLRQHSVPFEERDIEASLRARAEWSALDGFGIPLTLAGREIAYGMREEGLRRALASAGHRIDCRVAGPAAAPIESPLRGSQR